MLNLLVNREWLFPVYLHELITSKLIQIFRCHLTPTFIGRNMARDESHDAEGNVDDRSLKKKLACRL